MRRVLIVTSSYAPTMIADMQRVRQLAWELPKAGLGSGGPEPAPLSINQQHAWMRTAPFFFRQFASALRAGNVAGRCFEIAGIGNIGWRALLPLWVAGKRLLRQKHFDLVYISTAQFPVVFAWAHVATSSLECRMFWIFTIHLYKEGSRHPVWARPRLKHRISNALAKHLEEHVATRAQGLIAVSPKLHRYAAPASRSKDSQPGYARDAGLTIPFSALPRDLL